MRTYSILVSLLLTLAACSTTTEPAPYLIIEPTEAIFVGADSLHSATINNPLRVRMSDGSAFPIEILSTSGLTSAFTVTIDSGLPGVQRPIHTVAFEPNWRVVSAGPTPSDSVWEMQVQLGNARTPSISATSYASLYGFRR